MKTYYKLVRDRIPQIIVESGGKANYRHLDEDQVFNVLVDKIREEAEELRISRSPEELADLLSIINGLIDNLNLRKQDIIKAERKKTKKRGGFKDRVFLESVE